MLNILAKINLFEIKDFLDSCLNYDKHNIYVYFLLKNLDTRFYVVENLVKNLASKSRLEKHPNDYWEEYFFQRPFIEDVFDGHIVFWHEKITYVKDLVNKISLLSTDKKFKKICNKFSEDIEKVFYVAPNYKRSQKSNWFQNSQSYREFLENRENLKPVVKELFDNFEKDVEKYLGDK